MQAARELIVVFLISYGSRKRPGIFQVGKFIKTLNVSKLLIVP